MAKSCWRSAVVCGDARIGGCSEQNASATVKASESDVGLLQTNKTKNESNYTPDDSKPHRL